VKPFRACATVLALLASAGSAQAPKPFDPVAFFTGATHGEGVLKEALKKEKRVVVDSVGRAEKDGSLILEQKVAVQGEPVRHRRWKLRQTGPGRYSGAISDSTSRVEATVAGPTVRIGYTMKGGIKVNQVLTALPGGKAVENRTSFTKWGLKVATLTERIEKR